MNKIKLPIKKKLSSIILVIAIALALIFFMYSQIKRLVYQERKELLVQLVETSASTFDENISSNWRLINFYENTIESEINENTDISSFLSFYSQNVDDYYFLVDRQGKYYCSDGFSGKISDTEYYDVQSNIKSLEYLGSLPHLENKETYLIFRRQLDNPIKCLFNDSDVEIVYCGSIRSLNDITERISNLFIDENNTIIFNRHTGVMLYKQLNLGLLIDGYNIYDKYHKADALYNEDIDNTIDNIKNDNNTVSLLNINSHNVYICTSPLEVSDWTLLMVVNSEFFNQENSSNIVSILLTITLVILALSILFIISMTLSIKNKNNIEHLEKQTKLSQALEEAYKTKSDFLSYMSHDIRTPINGIIGMSRIGRNVVGNSDKTNDCFDKIDIASKHLLSLVNDVLDMSAIESGKVIIKQERFNLASLLNNCLDIIKGQLVNRELTLTSEIELPYENLIGDELHLKQVLINILGNAVKFTNDGGSIDLKCKQVKLENNIVTYSIIISDTGIGMSDKIKDHLFDAFVQGNNNRSQYKGTGLGMAISNQYVQMMNGTITVDSKENVGSTFIVEIPFIIDDSDGNEDIANMKILLVEDNELNIEIAKELLSEKGAIVSIAHNGRQAIEIFNSSKNEFDLILMDVMMPIMNGLEASKEIRKIDPNIPIIALSANTFKDDVDNFIEAGMNGYASKPLNIDSLIKTINEVKRHEKNI